MGGSSIFQRGTPTYYLAKFSKKLHENWTGSSKFYYVDTMEKVLSKIFTFQMFIRIVDIKY